MLITNIKELAKHRECKVSELKDDIYANTECGASIEWDKKGVTVGSIVENSEAEFDRRFDFPFESDGFDEWINELEYLCDAAWYEANDEVTWRRLAMVRYGIEYPHCHVEIYVFHDRRVIALGGEAGLCNRPRWEDTGKELTDDELEEFNDAKDSCGCIKGGCSDCPYLMGCSCDWLDEEVPEDKLDEYGLDNDDRECILSQAKEYEKSKKENKGEE